MKSCARIRDTLTFMIALFGVAVPACAQGVEGDTISHAYYVGVKAHGGFIIPHSTEIINVSGSRPVGFQVDAGRINRSVKAWNKCNCYSQVGLSFLYINYQNPEALASVSSSDITPIVIMNSVLICFSVMP